MEKGWVAVQQGQIVEGEGGDGGLGGERVGYGQLDLLDWNNAERLAGTEVGVVKEVKELQEGDLGWGGEAG